MKRQLIVDLETNGLLQEVTKIHCASVVDLNSSMSRLFLEKDMPEFIKMIDDPEVELIGHNIFCYDLMVIKKLLGWVPYKGQKIHDTLILGQLLFSDLKNDDKNNTTKCPGKIFSKRDTGSHSLRAWGQRIGQFKGEYSGGWELYSDDMGRYCIQDTYTTKGLFIFLTTKIPDKLLNTDAIDLEYSIAPILARQQAYGVLFDKSKAATLITTLTSKLVQCRWDLQTIFKPRYVFEGEFTPKKTSKKRNYTQGATFSKIKIQEFNPSSRTQIVDRLIKQFNWNPEEFTDAGRAKMNEDIIDALPFKELATLKEYLTIAKRISQIETGKQAWLNKIDADGRIRGAISQNGTTTGRMSHWGPNLAQVPSNDSLYGKECRELFIVPKTKIMLGVDADALEMRCLAGYLTPLDNGRFRDSLLLGDKALGTDPHSINMKAMDLQKFSEQPRDCAKTIFYAWLYGAKNAKIGAILLEYGVDFRKYVEDFDNDVKGMLEWIAKKEEETRKKGGEILSPKSKAYWECWVAGKQCLKLFGDRIPELMKLKERIHERVRKVGYIKGLDGRKLFMRSQHAELNTVLQSAGAIIMKKALSMADIALQDHGFVPGLDYEYILNIHDEHQIEVDKSVDIGIIKGIVEKSIEDAGISLGFPCPMKGNGQTGNSWAETH